MREIKIEEYLKREIEKLGGLCVKFIPTFFNGFPDRILLLPGGRIWFVETKAPGKKAGALQRIVHGMLTSRGFKVFILDSYEKIDKFIQDEVQAA